MKKTYVKPMVYFENMQFDSAIAISQCKAVLVSDCQAKESVGASCTPFAFSTCPPDKLFDENGVVCEYEWECYHISAGVQGLS